MKEWHRTVILILFLITAIVLVVISRQAPEETLTYLRTIA